MKNPKSLIACFSRRGRNHVGGTIAPFCTHEGSGLGTSERDIKGVCAGAKGLPGIAVAGGSVSTADADLGEWSAALPF